MCERAGKAYRDAHFEEAACARVLVNVDHQVARWGALDTPVLDVNPAAQHWCNLQASMQLCEMYNSGLDHSATVMTC